LLASIAVICCVGIGATTAQASRTNAITSISPETAVSSNWAGYVVGLTDGTTAASATFTSVSAQWVQPAVNCGVGESSYSAFWVGLGGATDASQALEQIGTASNCRAGTAAYSMWYELVPAASVKIKFKVFPGNVIAASVRVKGTQATLQIKNLTRRTNFTKKLRVSAPHLSSAEWIAEAPSGCNAAGRCIQLPLANFGSISFSRAAATAAGHAGTIGDPSWTATAIKLIEQPSVLGRTIATQPSPNGATPSTLSADGMSFAVDWQETNPA
jgi:Peptidase A4 family